MARRGVAGWGEAGHGKATAAWRGGARRGWPRQGKATMTEQELIKRYVFKLSQRDAEIARLKMRIMAADKLIETHRPCYNHDTCPEWKAYISFDSKEDMLNNRHCL